MKKVLCFGELLMRFSPRLNEEWLNTSTMPVYIGGAELNVANALAKFGIPPAYSTAIPDNYLSREITAFLNKRNIDTSPITYSGKRIGIYFLPGGADLKHDSVIYDRAHSSFADLKPGMLDWDRILDNVGWFHFSAIVPAISKELAMVCEEALKAALKKNIVVSLDLNYRKKLWQYGYEPKEIMPALAAYCDVIMANIWSANNMLNTPLDGEIIRPKTVDRYAAHARQTSLSIQNRFPRCKTVANTFRFDEGAGIHYYATICHNGQHAVSREFRSEKIADKAGSGDCFMAALITGMLNKWELQTIIDFAAAAAFGKLHESGDFTNQTMETVKKNML